MKLAEVYAELERVAPKSLSDEFCAKHDMYDNSGVILRCSDEISGILFSLDLSVATAKRARELGYNLIVTHHPAIYYGVKRLDTDIDPQAQAIQICMQNGISVISMHLNFDGAPEGIDYHLMKGLGGKTGKTLVALSNGGYGHSYEIAKKPLKVFVEEIRKTFQTQRVIYYGDDNREISKVLSCCGAGTDDNAINFAQDEGVDAYVSSDIKHHEISTLVERGIAVIALTHYSAETYGFKQIYQNIKDKLQVNSDFFTDLRLL